MFRYFSEFITSRSRYFWLLSALNVVILVAHSIYVASTHQHPEMDEQHYMDMATEFYRLLTPPTLTSFTDIFSYIPFRQPGYSLFVLPFLLIFGLSYSYQIALLINGLFYVTTILGIYFLGKEFFSKSTAFFCSFLFACFGWTLFYLHFTYSETATSTWILLSLLFLKKSNVFSNKKYSLLFGVMLGLGLLTRWVTLFFVIGPLIYVGFQLFKLPKKKRIKSIKQAVISVIIGLTIASPPYLINHQTFFGDYFKQQAFGGTLWEALPQEKKSFLSFRSATYYLKVFEQLTIPIFLLFLAGATIATIKFKKFVYILITFLIPFLIFSFATIIKDDRYVVPIYPSIALLCGIVIETLKNKWRLLLIGFFIILSAGNFFGALFGIGPLGQKGLASILVPMPIGHPRLIHYTTIVWPPRGENTNTRLIFNELENNKPRQNPKIIQLFSYHPVDIGLYSINTYHRREKMEINNFVGMVINDPEAEARNVADMLKNADFILTKSNNKTDNYFPAHNYTLLQKIEQTLNKDNKLILTNYQLIKTVSIPSDGTTVSIYKRMNKNIDYSRLESDLSRAFRL